MKKILLLLFLNFSILYAVPAGYFNWQDSTALHDGIRHVSIHTAEPRLMKINAVRIDLHTPGITLAANSKDADYGKPMPDYPAMTIQTKRTKVKDFLMHNRKMNKNMLVAVNSTPWGPWCKPFNHKYGGNIRLFISDGITIADRKQNIPAFILTDKNKVEIRTVSAQEDRSKFKIAMHGFEIILKNGKVTAKDKNLHPRTCYGISEDGRYLFFMTVDGRQKFISEGANTIECAEYLHYFGAFDAINMDGGGSTTLVNWNSKKQQPEILSRQMFGAERSVATCLGVIKK